MATISTRMQLTGLGKRKMAALAMKAKLCGMTPQRYLKQLVEDDLAADLKAKKTPLAKIMGPGCEVDEAELAALVEEAREEHYRRTVKK